MKQKTNLEVGFKNSTSKKKKFKTLLVMIMFLVTGFSYSQSNSETIKDWTTLEEADFLVDVSYKVVKCSSTNNPEVLLNVFNESGIKTTFGFTLHLKDANNNEENIVLDLSVPQAKMWIASCENNQYPQLKFSVPSHLDASSLSITITYKE